MITGCFTLAGTAEIPTFALIGHLINGVKGGYSLETDLDSHYFPVPSRDKEVLLYGDYHAALGKLDSSYAGLSYQDKLLQEGFGTTPGVIINKTTHGSLAVLGSVPAYGLYDTKSGSAFYFFTTDPARFNAILENNPLRYLIYRFPTAPVVFIQAEGVCSKWWRWMQTSRSVLHAFNALEHKLYGLQKA